MFAALGRATVRYRWLIVAFWIVVPVLLIRALPSLSSVTQNDNSAFLPASAPSQKAANLAKPFEQANLTTGVIVAASAGPLTTSDQLAVTRLEDAVRRIPNVKAVIDQGLSADGEARRALVETSVGSFDDTQSKQVVDAVRGYFLTVGASPGLALHFTGQLPTNVDETQATAHQQRDTERFSILFIIVLLLLVFRGLLAPLVTLAPAALSLSLSGPIIAEVAKAGVQVSGFTQFMLIVLVLGAGTDYGLFLIFRVREEMAEGRDPHAAVTAAVTRVGESISYSAMTVILAFVSLLFASFGLYRGLGPGLAIAIAVTLIVDLTLLPALLAILGRSVFWPRMPNPNGYHAGVWGRVASSVVKRPAATLAIGVVVFGGLAFANLRYSPAGFGSTTGSPSSSDSAIGLNVLTKHFRSVEANPTNVLFRLPTSVWAHPSDLESAESALSVAPVFSAVAGPLDPNGRAIPLSGLVALHTELAGLGPAKNLPIEAPTNLPAGISTLAYDAYRATAQFISPDGRTLQYYASLRAGDPGGNAALDAVPAIRRVVSNVGTGIGATESGVAGEAPALYDISSVSGADLLRVIPIVLVAILLLLILLLRSLVAPFYLIISVGLSYLAALGLAVLIWVIIGGESGINFILPFFMFIFLMALGQDYNILVMTRIREEAHDLPLPQAVQRAVASTGTTVTSAGLILAGTFVVLTIATTGSIREIGIGLAVGIVLDTFLVRSLLVPSVVVLLGRWNWWPSHLSRTADTAAPEGPGGALSGATPGVAPEAAR